jgi:hypothetical protein
MHAVDDESCMLVANSERAINSPQRSKVALQNISSSVASPAIPNGQFKAGKKLCGRFN